MGSCKQLLPLNCKPVIIHCIEAMISAAISDIIVVINSDGDAVIEATAGFQVTIARNEDRESDMAESVRVGLGKMAVASTGVIVALTDHPLVSSNTYSLLVERHRMEPDSVIVPVYEGKKGHPTLFSRAILEELKKPLTLRDIIRKHSDKVCEVIVPDRGVTLDMDTRKDYDMMQAIFTHFPISNIRSI